MNLLCDFKRSAILSGPAASFAEEFELDDKDPSGSRISRCRAGNR